MKASLLADEEDLDLILDRHFGKQSTKMDTSQEICSPRLPISALQGQKKRSSGTPRPYAYGVHAPQDLEWGYTLNGFSPINIKVLLGQLISWSTLDFCMLVLSSVCPGVFNSS